MNNRHPHFLVEQRSVALHRAVAEKLLASPELIQIAKKNLQRIADENLCSAVYLDAWKKILNLSIDRLAQEIISESQIMKNLRQSSPFAGILTPKERWKIYEQIK